MNNITLGFIGAGHLNSSIIAGLVNDETTKTCDCHEQKNNFISKKNIVISCKTPEKAQKITQDFGIECSTNNRNVIEKADFLILGVRPNQMREVLDEIKQYHYQDKTIISFAAAINIMDYRRILGNDVIIIRAMPNLAANCQSSLTGIWTDSELNDEQMEFLDNFFASFGASVWLDDETQIDGITALSGSGIAYFFRLMQAMAKTGERYGFSPDELFDIISLTALGAATSLIENPDAGDFSTRVKHICTKGGTTEAALKHFEIGKIDDILESAMQAAVERSRALSEQITKDW